MFSSKITEDGKLQLFKQQDDGTYTPQKYQITRFGSTYTKTAPILGVILEYSGCTDKDKFFNALTTANEHKVQELYANNDSMLLNLRELTTSDIVYFMLSFTYGGLLSEKLVEKSTPDQMATCSFDDLGFISISTLADIIEFYDLTKDKDKVGSLNYTLLLVPEKYMIKYAPTEEFKAELETKSYEEILGLFNPLRNYFFDVDDGSKLSPTLWAKYFTMVEMVD